MGGLIIGILAIVFAGAVVITADGSEGAGLFVMLLILAAVCLGVTFAGNGPEYASSVVKIEEITPVAGYYVSDSGDYVTASGKFGHLSSGDIEGGLAEGTLTKAPIILTIETKHRGDFWHIKNTTTTKQILRFDNHDE